MSAAVLPALGLPGRVDGIDVSSFQVVDDVWKPNGVAYRGYEAVAAAGFRFAIVRASGATFVDASAKKHLAGFRAAGLYTFVYAAASPKDGHPREQAKRLYDASGAVFACRFAIDLEVRGTLSNQAVVDFAEAFVDEAATFGVLKPVLYTYPWFAQTLQPELGRSSLGATTDLWMASIAGAEPWTPPPGFSPTIPRPWTTWAIHQYGGDRGFRVPGVFGACDRDLFRGDEAGLRSWLGFPTVSA